jgi:sugar/nucleoside kinase (ribokinase family)
VAIVKVGKDGSFIEMDGKITAIAPVDAKRVDTTGAGDIYASGFLFGYTNGYDSLQSGNLASYLSARLIEYVGAKLPDDEWMKIKKEEL